DNFAGTRVRKARFQILFFRSVAQPPAVEADSRWRIRLNRKRETVGHSIRLLKEKARLKLANVDRDVKEHAGDFEVGIGICKFQRSVIGVCSIAIESEPLNVCKPARIINRRTAVLNCIRSRSDTALSNPRNKGDCLYGL